MIKRAIMQYGAVSVGIHMGDMDSSNYNAETGAYYSGLHLGEVMVGVDKDNDGEDDTVATDHAVAIVGWDDDYPSANFANGKQPKENGAWIVRNSWAKIGETADIATSHTKKARSATASPTTANRRRG